MPIRKRGRRTRGTLNISEPSKVPHPLPQSEESEHYKNAHEDSAVTGRLSTTLITNIMDITDIMDNLDNLVNLVNLVNHG